MVVAVLRAKNNHRNNGRCYQQTLVLPVAGALALFLPTLLRWIRCSQDDPSARFVGASYNSQSAIFMPSKILLPIETGHRDGSALVGSPTIIPYHPAPCEEYVVKEARALGLDTLVVVNETAASCNVITNASASPYYREIQQYIKELAHYGDLLNNFTAIPEIRQRLINDPTNSICNTLELHPEGLAALFPSGQLSLSSSGYIEPLLPPLRHPGFCGDVQTMEKHLFRLDYLVHDFAFSCRKLKPTSRTVLVDMGAALHFKGDESPVDGLIRVFRQFGIHFDHVYAYEITPSTANDVYKIIPRHLHSSYHWINAAVDHDPRGVMNPLRMIAESFTDDDFVVVKLDVDTPWLENELVRQLLHNSRFSTLIDHFYFEHHVISKEMVKWWGPWLNESVKDSLDVFSALRKKGIPAHYWV